MTTGVFDLGRRLFRVARRPGSTLAIFGLSHPRYLGLHDPLAGPVVGGGAADLRLLMVGGRIVVENSVIPGLDLEKLRRDAAAIVKRIAA